MRLRVSNDGCLPLHPSSFSFHAVARRTPTLLQHSSRRHRNDQRCQSTSTWFPCSRVSRVQGLAFTSHAYVMTSCVVSPNVAPMNAPHFASEFFFARQENCTGGRTRRNSRVVCLCSRQNRYATCESQTKEWVMTCTIAALACVTFLTLGEWNTPKSKLHDAHLRIYVANCPSVMMDDAVKSPTSSASRTQ